MSKAQELPLSGTVVVDLSRHLPGAILARTLIDLGARLIKVEDPRSGDPLRSAPPLVSGGVGAGFAVLLRGAESICLDLSSTEGAASLEALTVAADVLVESFRPGTMERFGLGAPRLLQGNPRLVYCAISGYGLTGEPSRRIAHDMNLTASSGLLTMLPPGDGLPRVQLADVGSAQLAATAITAALFRRERTGEGGLIDQPLAAGVMPLLSWTWADEAGGGGGLNDETIAGGSPGYRVYRCGDGRGLAVGTLEPKFWRRFCEVIGTPELAEVGLDTGPEGQAAAAKVEARLMSRPRAEWLAQLEEPPLPVSPVDDLAVTTAPGGFFDELGLSESTPLAGGEELHGPGPYLPSLGRTPLRPAPALGEHTEAILRELARGR